MHNTLFLRLEAPLQSWGERARWSIRDTAPEPTKSGVVGMLGCSLGISADEALCELSRAVRMGVRCDRPGTILEDYHTVVGGVMSAEGKLKRNATTKEPETVVSQRSYLCDASFLVAVQSAPEWITRLADAVQAPHWPIFLGRKCCVPTRPVFDGTSYHDSLEDALRTHDSKQARAVLECSAGEGVMRRDEIDSNTRRTFLPRYIRELLIESQPTQQE